MTISLRERIDAARFPKEALLMSFWWAWVYLTYLSPSLASSTSCRMGVPALSFLSVASGAVVCMVLVPVFRRRPLLQSNRSLALASGLLACVATFVMGFSQSDPGGLGSAIAALVSGVGITVLYVQWGTLYSQMGYNQSVLATLTSFLLALVLAAAIYGHGSTTVVLESLLPLGCAAGLCMKQAWAWEPPANPRLGGSGLSLSIPWYVLALIVIFGATFGVYRSVLSGASVGSLQFGVLLTGSAALAIALLALVALFRASLGWDFVVYLTLPMMGMAALALSLNETIDAAVLWAAVVAIVRCSDLVIWILLTELSRKANDQPGVIFAVGKLASLAAVLLGMVVGAVFVLNVGEVQRVFLPVAIVVIMALAVLASIVSLREGRQAAAAASLKPVQVGESPEESALDAVATRYGLSRREREVLGYLARGRSVPYIAEKLTIAESTVTSHSRSIYRKTGVHSRQQLIDLVERSV